MIDGSVVILVNLGILFLRVLVRSSPKEILLKI